LIRPLLTKFSKRFPEAQSWDTWWAFLPPSFSFHFMDWFCLVQKNLAL
jgi:hypothetical protein